MFMLNHICRALKLLSCKGCNILFCFVFISFFPKNIFSQNTQTIIYTVKDGLPSNALYRTAIDKRGFLWIATEIGLSRFDGKKFRNYNTSDGLSDNEITDLFTDSSGTLWIIPFQRPPCFYNATADRFENAETNPQLAKLESTNWVHVLKFGGVAFSNYYQHFIVYKNNSVIKYSNENFKVTYKIIDYQPDCFLLFSSDSIRRYAKGKLESLIQVNKTILMAEAIGDNVYIATPNSILQYHFNRQGEVSLITEKKYPFELRTSCRTGKRFAITSLNGTTYLLNTNNLDIAEIVSAVEAN